MSFYRRNCRRRKCRGANVFGAKVAAHMSRRKCPRRKLRSTVKFAINQIITLEENLKEQLVSRVSSDSLTNFESKRKEFVISYFKNEITGYHESLYPRNSDAFRYIQNFALRKCKLYFIAIFFAIIFAAAPPSFTKLNGDLYEFYKGNDSKKYLEDGYRISHRYYSLGTIYCTAGFLAALFFGINGERIAFHLRKTIFDNFVASKEILSDSKKIRLVSLLTKSINQCKSAYDICFFQFCVGIFSLFFGIGFIFEKNFPTAFVSSICFFLQAIAQYFVSRVAEIQTKREISKRNKFRQEELDEFRKIPESNIGEKMDALNIQYSKYLHLSHHRLSSVIGLEALKFFAITALPQITQAISYILCCFLTSEGYVGPIVVYKVIQTIYMSSISISTISQFTNNIHQARLGAREMNDLFEKTADKISSTMSKAKVFAA